jgi:hypothetical protein
VGFLDSAKSALSKNKDKVMQGIDAATVQARKITPAQHSAKLSKAANAAKSAVDKLDSTANPSDAGSTGNEDSGSASDTEDASTEQPDSGSAGDTSNG